MKLPADTLIQIRVKRKWVACRCRQHAPLSGSIPIKKFVYREKSTLLEKWPSPKTVPHVSRSQIFEKIVLHRFGVWKLIKIRVNDVSPPPKIPSTRVEWLFFHRSLPRQFSSKGKWWSPRLSQFVTGKIQRWFWRFRQPNCIASVMFPEGQFRAFYCSHYRSSLPCLPSYHWHASIRTET